MDTLIRKNLAVSFVVSWSIFFGPVVLAIPVIVVQEMTVILLFQCVFLFHGIVSAGTASRLLLDSPRDPFRAGLLGLHSCGRVYNGWTTENGSLVCIRLIFGLVGLWIGFELLWTWFV
ncbi:hypothetical protein C8J56DRAFT_358360 [Mycena floridula]|nr:hypothetical protein C8J56DRAFT_358360 [Mycena floridula]